MTLNREGNVKVPSCPMRTATMSVQAVVPIEKPRIRTRPRMVPSATDSSRKISGAAEMIHLTVLMVQALQRFALNLVRQTRRCLIQINPAGVKALPVEPHDLTWGHEHDGY